MLISLTPADDAVIAVLKIALKLRENPFQRKRARTLLAVMKHNKHGRKRIVIHQDTQRDTLRDTQRDTLPDAHNARSSFGTGKTKI